MPPCYTQTSHQPYGRLVPPPPPLCWSSFLAAEREAHERARFSLLNKVHAARTPGVKSEALILFECGRVLAEESTKDGRRAALPCSVTNGQWASYVCRELRRNRFAAQRGAMRRNVLPGYAPPTIVGQLSPPPPSPGKTRTNPFRSPVSTIARTSTAENKRQGGL